DPEFTGAIETEIKDQKVNAEAALDETAQKFITIFEGMTDNAYMQERAADIKDVTDRLIAHLIGAKIPNLSLIDEDAIVIAPDLTP
ncbi:phosphoenolpyruvate-utilizing N-terminal domain-containing protein, partial [Pauljensenia sp. UMB0018B]|nr:phosphoenolpyruvate-utilizing N-terminal domain-containing protein [Pauljensenia sp. UMB0018B]